MLIANSDKWSIVMSIKTTAFFLVLSMTCFEASAQMQQPKNFRPLQPGYWQQSVSMMPARNNQAEKTEFRCMETASVPGFITSEQAKQCRLQVLEDSAKAWKVQSFCPNGLQSMFKLEMVSPLQAALQIDSLSPKGRTSANGQLKFLGACPESAAAVKTVDPAKLGKLSAEQCRLVTIQFEAMAPDKAAVTCSKHDTKLRQACLTRAAKSYSNLDKVLKSDACK
jgi:hypothetical protein